MAKFNIPYAEERKVQKEESPSASHQQKGYLKHSVRAGYSIIPSERQVKQILWRLGVPVHMRGYLYLKSAILLVITHAEPFYMLTKEIYPSIAKKYGSTVSCVERDIRYVISAAWSCGGMDEWNAMHGFTTWKTTSTPTNSEFIAMIADYLFELNRQKCLNRSFKCKISARKRHHKP